jgi:hypothetical protein
MFRIAGQSRPVGPIGNLSAGGRINLRFEKRPVAQSQRDVSRSQGRQPSLLHTSLPRYGQNEGRSRPLSAAGGLRPGRLRRVGEIEDRFFTRFCS